MTARIALLTFPHSRLVILDTTHGSLSPSLGAASWRHSAEKMRDDVPGPAPAAPHPGISASWKEEKEKGSVPMMSPVRIGGRPLRTASMEEATSRADHTNCVISERDASWRLATVAWGPGSTRQLLQAYLTRNLGSLGSSRCTRPRRFRTAPGGGEGRLGAGERDEL